MFRTVKNRKDIVQFILLLPMLPDKQFQVT